MPEFTLRIRRYLPESGEAPYWQDYTVDLEGHRSVLEGILTAKADQDGSIGIRCSCRAAICGSCGVRINGRAALACKTHLEEALESSQSDDEIVVEPMGNMPVLKDLIVDMDAVHWKKIQRVTPWLLPEGPPPEREYVVPHEAMVDVTQSMACIQCGACVSDCLSMEVDPDFIGPAALAKAYRFVGDPRDAEQFDRLKDLAEDAHGIYDCTHCFKCIEACPKGVAPMNQIMRLRRLAGHDHDIQDVNNGRNHELAFTKIIQKKGTLDESLLLQESFAPGFKGKLKPNKRAIREMLGSIPTAIRGIKTGKMRSLHKLIPGVHPKLPDQDDVKAIYAHAEEHNEEFNLYIKGEEGELAEENVEKGIERSTDPETAQEVKNG
ncbi:MAG: succinate dehydrogenase/fumarate reductase iron-sulfur subunit [Solirubrobacteraceae bacterium]